MGVGDLIEITCKCRYSFATSDHRALAEFEPGKYHGIVVRRQRSVDARVVLHVLMKEHIIVVHQGHSADENSLQVKVVQEAWEMH